MADLSLPVKQLLKANRLSITAPRRLVFDKLSHSEPMTMQELINACLPQIDPVSVYRTVELFEKLGVVQRLQIGWKYKLELSNAYQDHHHHLSCTNCSKTIPLPEDESLERRLLELAKQQNFQPQDHQIEIRGLCADCKNLKTRAEARVL